MFITFEGREGSGKTTQRRLLVNRLQTFTDIEVIDGHNLDGTDVGTQLRSVLQHRDTLSAVTVALIVSAMRSALVQQVIKPALRRHAIVICDRYIDSPLALPDVGITVPADHRRALCTISSDNIMPDLTIYLDIPATIGYARTHHPTDGQKSSPQDTEITHHDLRANAVGEMHRRGYQELILEDPRRWYVIDGQTNSAAPPDIIHEMIYQRVTMHPLFLAQILPDPCTTHT